MSAMTVIDVADALLRDGASIEIRALQANDRALLRNLFDSLRDDSARSRFFAAKQDASDAALDAITTNNAASSFALAATTSRGGSERILGVGRYRALPENPRIAEVMFDIASAEQGRGIATLLLEKLAGVASNHGISMFCADVEVDNQQMLDVFGNSGFVTHASPQAGVYRVEIQLAETDALARESMERARVSAAHSLRSLFAPTSVAIIGASRSPGNVGRSIVENLVKAEFRGAIYPVNPAATEIAGQRCYLSLSSIVGNVDLAIIAVPARSVKAVLSECATKGVGSAVIISAGFAETSGSGRDVEHQLRNIARSAGMRMVGPNCMGVLSTNLEVRLNATFSPNYPPVGNVSMATQSGALGLAMLDYARGVDIGIADFISIGNNADVAVTDLLSRWYDDSRTKVIALYLESFGDAHAFMQLAPDVARRKPIVAIKSGRSPAGTRAASSHSAALANLDAGVDAIFAQTGVLRVDTLEELFDVVSLLANQPIPVGSRVAVVTNAGGPGILVADSCAAHGLSLPTLEPATLEALRTFLPAQASVSNPIDMIAAAPVEHFRRTIELVGRDPNVDALIVIYVPPMVTQPNEIAAAIAQAAGTVPDHKPIATVFMAAAGARPELSTGPRGKLPSYRFPESAATALAAAARYGAWRSRPSGAHLALSTEQRTAVRARIRDHLAGDRDHSNGEWLSFAEIFPLLSDAGIQVADYRIVTDTAAAVGAANELHYPVVLKSIAPGVLHKTDVGGVALNLGDALAVESAANAMRDRFSVAGFEIDGFLVQQQSGAGIEAIIGASIDPTLGPLIVAGIGGVAVELYKDVALRRAPMTDIDADDMLEQLRGRKLLAGFRGAPPADRPALVDILRRVSALVEAVPEIAEIDLNPVIVQPLGLGAVVVDARIRLIKAATSRP